MLGRWFKRRARVERVEPLLLGAALVAPSDAHAASGAAMLHPAHETGPSLVAGAGALSAPEAPSQNPTPPAQPFDLPDLSAPQMARLHAKLLLRFVTDSDWTGAGAMTDVVMVDDAGRPVLLASTLLDIYREMCAERGIAERPWNPIARELRALTGDRKGYAWVERSGIKHRLRVYRFDVVLAGRVHGADAPWASEAPSKSLAPEAPSKVIAA